MTIEYQIHILDMISHAEARENGVTTTSAAKLHREVWMQCPANHSSHIILTMRKLTVHDVEYRGRCHNDDCIVDI